MGEVGVQDEDVVKVDHVVFEQDDVLEDVIHHCLEGSWGVSKAKVNHQWLKEPLSSMESCLPFVIFPDPDVFEPPSDIELCEEPSSLQTVNEVIYQRELVPVFHGHRVDCLVVLDKPKGSVLLNEEDRRHHQGPGGTDAAGTQDP
jgi:hypothetical protein